MSDKSGSITASIAVGAVVIVLAVIFVALRFYMRITTHAGLKWDDWLSLLAVLLIIVIDVILLWGEDTTPLMHAQKLILIFKLLLSILMET